MTKTNTIAKKKVSNVRQKVKVKGETLNLSGHLFHTLIACQTEKISNSSDFN